MYIFLLNSINKSSFLFSAGNFAFEATVSLIFLYAGLSPSGGKIDRIPLSLSSKWVRVWNVRHLPSHILYFRAGYWIVDGDDDIFGCMPFVE